MITNSSLIIHNIRPYDIKNYDLIITLLAQECIHGTFGNGNKRKEMLGSLYYDVQNRINRIMDNKHG